MLAFVSFRSDTTDVVRALTAAMECHARISGWQFRSSVDSDIQKNRFYNSSVFQSKITLSLPPHKLRSRPMPGMRPADLIRDEIVNAISSSNIAVFYWRSGPLVEYLCSSCNNEIDRNRFFGAPHFLERILKQAAAALGSTTHDTTCRIISGPQIDTFIPGSRDSGRGKSFFNESSKYDMRRVLLHDWDAGCLHNTSLADISPSHDQSKAEQLVYSDPDILESMNDKIEHSTCLWNSGFCRNRSHDRAIRQTIDDPQTIDKHNIENQHAEEVSNQTNDLAELENRLLSHTLAAPQDPEGQVLEFKRLKRTSISLYQGNSDKRSNRHKAAQSPHDTSVPTTSNIYSFPLRPAKPLSHRKTKPRKQATNRRKRFTNPPEVSAPAIQLEQITRILRPRATIEQPGERLSGKTSLLTFADNVRLLDELQRILAAKFDARKNKP